MLSVDCTIFVFFCILPFCNCTEIFYTLLQLRQLFFCEGQIQYLCAFTISLSVSSKKFQKCKLFSLARSFCYPFQRWTMHTIGKSLWNKQTNKILDVLISLTPSYCKLQHMIHTADWCMANRKYTFYQSRLLGWWLWKI